MSAQPRIWALLGEKIGDNNQLLALAEGLELPFETRPMRYSLARAVPPRYLGATLATLTPSSRRWLSPPWPDLVLAIGRRSVPVARWIRNASGGLAKLVLVGHPRVDPRHFDLVLTTSQYPVPRKGNVVVLPLAMSRLRDPGPPTAEEHAWLDRHSRPLLLFALGGPTKYWNLEPSEIAGQARKLVARARMMEGSLVVVGSRRTPRNALEAAREQLGDADSLVVGTVPRFATLMAQADEIFVTADSVSMLSEAIQTGKPVGMVPISLSGKGKRLIGPGGSYPKGRRDLRRIWQALLDHGLVGSVEQPVAGATRMSAVGEAVESVRKLMEFSDA